MECSGGSLYTGYTRNPKKRVQAHKNGHGSRYTRSHLPIRLVHLERFRFRSSALRREMEIKRLPREKKLKLLD